MSAVTAAERLWGILSGLLTWRKVSWWAKERHPLKKKMCWKDTNQALPWFSHAVFKLETSSWKAEIEKGEGKKQVAKNLHISARQLSDFTLCSIDEWQLRALLPLEMSALDHYLMTITASIKVLAKKEANVAVIQFSGQPDMPFVWVDAMDLLLSKDSATNIIYKRDRGDLISPSQFPRVRKCYHFVKRHNFRKKTSSKHKHTLLCEDLSFSFFSS